MGQHMDDFKYFISKDNANKQSRVFYRVLLAILLLTVVTIAICLVMWFIVKPPVIWKFVFTVIPIVCAIGSGIGLYGALKE